MTGYYVFYNDDYYDMGGVGLKSFDEADEATQFIESRMKEGRGRTLEDYTVIFGTERPLVSVETVTKIKID